MIKNFKIFEDTYNPKIGDYVICYDLALDFKLENYVGKIVNYKEHYFYVKYNYKELPNLDGFESYGEIGVRPFNFNELIRLATKDEIKEYKLNKKANKYNL
jgi:hypothetical protein